jgi:signal transduction histidine kinase/CheY-like chemotaxis protein
MRDVVAGGVIARVRAGVAWLPRGRGLPRESWRRRHRGLRLLLWAHLPALLIFGALKGYGGPHAILHLAPITAFAMLGGWDAVPRRAQAVSVTMGLLTAAALGVHISDGLTESHFLFFVLVIGFALYEDWLVFLVAVGFVVLHHGLVPMLGLGEVYSHPQANLLWATVHGAFVLFAAALCIVSWRASEQARAELQVAERQKLESQLRESQKLESLGLLAGGLAHDFNNLLVGVLGNAALVREDLPPDSALRVHVEQIELAGQRAAALTRQMLAYSGSGRLELTPVDVPALVEEIAHLIAAAISKQARLELDLDTAAGITVLGDPGQLSQVVMNLITNAAESLDGEGTVSVRTGLVPACDRVFIQVSDTGCGMNEDTLSQIFEPFYTTKFTGRGLGLAAVSGIIRSHGGEIDVHSRVGEGTTFRVVLPTVTAAPPSKQIEPTALLHPSGRILVVDDEPAVLDVACHILERHGYDVVSATSGFEAIRRLGAAEGPIDAAIVDMSMPGLNGLETMQGLRRDAPALPVILSSGYTTESFYAGLPPGTRFLQKPYAGEDLLALLQAVICEAAVA